MTILILLSALKQARVAKRYQRRSRNLNKSRKKRRVMFSLKLKMLSHLNQKSREESFLKNAKPNRMHVKKRFLEASNRKK
jgi:hypothetical protein